MRLGHIVTEPVLSIQPESNFELNNGEQDQVEDIMASLVFFAHEIKNGGSTVDKDELCRRLRRQVTYYFG